MKILLLGKNGQVGWELQRALGPLGELIALDRNGQDGLCGDLSQPELLRQSILELQPDVVVNAGAYTAVDLAESHPDDAALINVHAVKAIAEACLETGALLVHYSTDYVFDGQGDGFMAETAATHPLNVYGQTKAQGEQIISASGCQHLIFRTSWVYASKGKNFLKTMLNLAKQRETLSIIEDQIGAPTSAELIADVTAHALIQTLASPAKSGLYHLTASGQASWYDYACFIFQQAKQAGETLCIKEVHAIASSAYPAAAQRPLNSILNNQKLQQTFQLTLPHWKTGVHRTLMELVN